MWDGASLERCPGALRTTSSRLGWVRWPAAERGAPLCLRSVLRPPAAVVVLHERSDQVSGHEQGAPGGTDAAGTADLPELPAMPADGEVNASTAGDAAPTLPLPALGARTGAPSARAP